MKNNNPNAVGKGTMSMIRSLEQKKFREREGCFVAEGPKVVGDLACRFRLVRLFATDEWTMPQSWDEHQKNLATRVLVRVDNETLRRFSFLQHPQQVMALFSLPVSEPDPLISPDVLALALDRVQDPGNLGTIIRVADWFGIKTIYCSPETADAYSPKVVQATMGSLARVQVVYTPLPQLLDRYVAASLPVYGTHLHGENLYAQPLSSCGIIVMGNEGRGISEEVCQRLTHRLLIPSFPPDSPTAESLNVAIATAIVCSEFRRSAQESR